MMILNIVWGMYKDDISIDHYTNINIVNCSTQEDKSVRNSRSEINSILVKHRYR